jgi:hypothetical protein
MLSEFRNAAQLIAAMAGAAAEQRVGIEAT